MKTQYILSIDQGTTGTTLSLINTKGQLKVKVNREFRQIFPKPGWVEHSPEDIWRSVRQCLQEIFKKTKVDQRQILSIGITNQRETVMAWDKKSGEAIGNAIVWQCRRTTEICEKLKKRGVEAQVHRTTGLVLDPYFSATKMQWILNNNLKAKRRAQQSQLALGTVDSFLLWKLTGGRAFATDVSNASRTLLMDLKTLDYSPEMLKLFGLNRSMLPQILPSGGVFGKTVKGSGLIDGIPVTAMIGDQQAALFGQLCFSSGEAKITFGTGSFLLMNTKSKKVISRNGLLTTVAWQLAGQKKADYALEGGAFICGAAVQWLRDNFNFLQSSQDIEKLALKVKDCGGAQFVPAFSGLGAPFWDPRVRGAWLGLTRGTNKCHMSRATLEAMALQNVDVVQTMVKDSKMKIKKVRVDGGAASNNLLMQMQANMLGTTIMRPQYVESTSRGAALLAGLSVGVWSSLNDLKKVDKIDKQFKSQWTTKQRQLRLKEWHQAIKACKAYSS